MDSSPIDILLVEDNPNDVKLALHAFKRSNLANSIHVARDGVEALEFLFGTGPQVLADDERGRIVYTPEFLSAALAQQSFVRLLADVPWQAERRRMYERDVAVPRLLASYALDGELPAPLPQLAQQVRDHVGAPFTHVGLNLYRDGRDSVAWHGDRIGRGRSENTMVAIVSLGAERKLSLRPRQPGGERVDFPVGHGDRQVMGGSCQRTWDHAVLKTAKPVGPRISVQFRPLNVL